MRLLGEQQGGNRAIKQMKKMVHVRNGEVVDSGVVNWSNKMREEQINDLVGRFSKLV